jgi:hypothetical protein
MLGSFEWLHNWHVLQKGSAPEVSKDIYCSGVLWKASFANLPRRKSIGMLSRE